MDEEFKPVTEKELDAPNDKGEAAATHPEMKQSYSRSPRPACQIFWDL